MKIVDKFALVPIERYNQLIKGENYTENKYNNTGKEPDKKSSKEVISTDSLPNNDKELFTSNTSNITSDKDPSSITNITADKDNKKGRGDETELISDNLVKKGRKSFTKDTNPKSEKKVIDIDGKILRKRKKAIPRPPPGIPNKVRKRHFRWLKLF